VLMIVGTGLGASASLGRKDPYPHDRELTLSDVQMLGTHNSYHVRPDRDLIPNEPADYEHPPLDVQLGKEGIRSLELDAFDGPTFPVMHSLLVDEGSTCPTLAGCLATVQRWSRMNPGHLPLILFVEPKALPVNADPGIQAALDQVVADRGLATWDAAALDRLDALLHKTFGRSLITPDEVRGKRPTLRTAITKDGWPTLAATRGRVLVVLGSTAAERDLYLTGAPSLQGRAMFVPSDVADPYAAIIKRDVPLPNAFPRIVQRNFLVKTRADADGVEARAGDLTRATTALASGATVVATDYPVADPKIGAYLVDLPGTAVARCNPVTAPKWCRDRDLENASGMHG
jgi:Phosphoinositide phospholipase C, Ca2+-dependent